ncbi:MAG TPA: PEP-CTERM sorting domain-containing protein [Casimicrobiaceae bacterium]|nr:PEP-CTERM sorting domain-containing protein [Casimicrobiaceae bacterium]
MNRKRTLLGPVGLAAGVGMLLPAATGHAAVISQNHTFTVTSTVTNVTDPGEPSSSDNESTTVTFDQFDPLLGTLTGIDISLDSTLAASLSVSGSVAERSDNSTSTWDGTVTLTMPGVNFSDPHTFTVSCDFGSCSNSSSPSFDELTGISLSPVDFASYIGTGSVTASLALDLTVSVSNNFMDEPAAKGSGSGTWDPPPPEGLNVLYTYTPAVTPVPEPGTLALVAMGALAGMASRRRRAKEDG